MNRSSRFRFVHLLRGWATASPAETPQALPSPFNLGDVILVAGERKDDTGGARA